MVLPHEVGHHHCFFALARRMSAFGCEVTFVGSEDDRSTVEVEGFAFCPALASPFPSPSPGTDRASLRQYYEGSVAAVAAHGRAQLPDSAAHCNVVICDGLFGWGCL
jgi:hypothetical protein